MLIELFCISLLFGCASFLIADADEHDEASAIGSSDGSEGHRQQTGCFPGRFHILACRQICEVEHQQSVRFLENKVVAFILSELSGRINVLPLLDAFIKLIVAFHQRHAHSEIGDTLLRIVFGDTFQKTVNGFRTHHQLVLFVGSCNSKLHFF